MPGATKGLWAYSSLIAKPQRWNVSIRGYLENIQVLSEIPSQAYTDPGAKVICTRLPRIMVV